MKPRIAGENNNGYEMKKAQENLQRLESWFRNFDSVLVAFSSGVDSSVLAYAARRTLRERAVAVNSVSKSLAESEKRNADLIAKEIGIELVSVFQNDLEDREYVANLVSRCYFCRTNLSSAVIPIARERGIPVWVDGSHVDDMQSPRPGIKALRENGFRAPFVELGFNKQDIRAIALSVGLSNAERPAEACLSSRIAYGQKIDALTLERIEKAEEYIRALIRPRVVRVRTIKNRAVVEVDKQSVEKASALFPEIESGLQALGYSQVVIDPEGYSSGRMLALYVTTFKEE